MDWIKITDTEPVLDVAIIAFDTDKGVVPCVCRNNGFGKKCYWFWNDDTLNLSKITHWMPLPHAPESAVTSTNKPMPVAPKPCATCGNCTALVPRCSLSVDVDDAPWIKNECPDYKPRTCGIPECAEPYRRGIGQGFGSTEDGDA